jgi:hypothetical protein
MAINIGDIVQVVDRVPTPADLKSGLFYTHFRNLAGAVERVYDDGAVCVVVDHAALSRDMLARLRRAERVIKPRWKTADATAEVIEESSAPATEAGLSNVDDSESGTDDEPGEDNPDGGIPLVAASTVVEEQPVESRTHPGLRYAIILKAEDLHVLRQGDRPLLTEHPEEQMAPAMVSAEQVKAAEQRQIGELLRRADGQRH